MKAKAKTGDLVCVTTKKHSILKFGEVVEIGTVFSEVNSHYEVNDRYYDNGDPLFLRGGEFLLINNPEDYTYFYRRDLGDNGNITRFYKPKDEQSKTKTGDLVRVTTEGLDVVNAGEVFKVGKIKPSVSGFTRYEMLGSSPENDDNVFLFGDEFELLEEESPQQVDAVNHPSHYTQGRFETIEVIEEIAGGYDDGYVAYCVGNAIKYLSRAPHKHATPVEDLRKAATYIDFAIKAETRRAT